MATYSIVLRRTLQVLLAFTFVALVVHWQRAPNPNHLANLGWSFFLMLTGMLMGPWWGNRLAIGAFASIVGVAIASGMVRGHAQTGISRKVNICFFEEIKATGKTQLAAPEVGEVLNRSVGCAEKRINSFERFFWNEERAKNSVRFTPLK